MLTITVYSTVVPPCGARPRVTYVAPGKSLPNDAAALRESKKLTSACGSYSGGEVS